jgi:hypothetical protein
MKNLGKTRRWAARAGAVERAIAKLKARGPSLDANVDQVARTTENQAPAPGLEPGNDPRNPRETVETGGKSGL